MSHDDDATVPRRKMRRKSVFDRSTSDLLVLMIAFTICSSVVVGGSTVLAVEFINPQADTTRAVVFISDIINTLIGLLAGFLAGRTDAAQSIIKAKEKAEAEAEVEYRHRQENEPPP